MKICPLCNNTNNVIYVEGEIDKFAIYKCTECNVEFYRNSEEN